MPSWHGNPPMNCCVASLSNLSSRRRIRHECSSASVCKEQTRSLRIRAKSWNICGGPAEDCVPKWHWPFVVRKFRIWCSGLSNRKGGQMNNSPPVVRHWLAGPLPADVSRAIDRLEQTDDVRHVALLPDV